MDIRVTPFGAADETALGRAYEIEVAARDVDAPDLPPCCRQRFFGGFHHPRPGEELRAALALRDGQPAGYVRISLPQRENRENALVTLVVHPEHRRHGVGRALYDHTVRLLREIGRKRILADSVIGLPGSAGTTPGAAFAAAMGAHAALTDIRRRLDVTALDQDALDRLLAESWPRAAGYSVVRWPGPAPDEYAEDVAYLDSRLLEDAPLGDLTMEAERPDVARKRAVEATNTAWGKRWYNCGVRHDATGRLVAWTAINFSASVAWHAYQSITLVEPRHRGHRLGTIIKIENLRYVLAHEPALRYIDTYNAAENDHMIAINDALGFQAVDGLMNWQVTI